jgi:hypothetical protein
MVIMGALWEATAFIIHALGAHNQQSQAYAVSYQILFFLAPIWISAYIYMTVARLVYFFLTSQSLMKIQAASLANYFAWSDVVTFVVQAVGAGMAAPGSGSMVVNVGSKIYMVGIGIQEALILFCFVLLLTLHGKVAALEKTMMSIREQSWRPLQWALYGALLAITVRPLTESARSSSDSNRSAISSALVNSPVEIPLPML